ncbi:MAG: response regulator [Pseudomonadota bacterium]
MQEAANILVVDDELGPRESLRMILKPLSNVYTVRDGEEALEFIRQNPVNLVTLDLKMPGIPGLEVLKEIKGYKSEIEVIVLTGYGSLDTAIEALRYGALDYITKPFDIPQVEEAVRKALNKYQFNILSRQMAQNFEIPKEEIPDLVKSGAEQLEEQLLYAKKLTILGQLAPKIAHEINNPLQIIYGRAQQGLMKSKGEETLKSYFESVLKEAERIDHIAQQLMRYGRPIAYRKDRINVEDILKSCIGLLKDFGEIKRCEIHEFYREGLPLIRGDKSQLEQVFINLIINASHAMEEAKEKKLVIETSASSDGAFVEVGVTDTGYGIPEENIKHIFTPFFTTKEAEKGNGLGLSVVKSFVNKHQGRIEVASSLGKGTTFKIILPVDSNGEQL